MALAVYDARGERLLRVAGELELLVGEERRHGLEGDAVTYAVGGEAVDLKELDHREELVALARRAHGAADGVAALEAVVADLLRRDVDVVGRGEVVEVRRAKETVAVGHHLEDALGLYDALILKGETAVFAVLVLLVGGGLGVGLGLGFLRGFADGLGLGGLLLGFGLGIRLSLLGFGLRLGLGLLDGLLGEGVLARTATLALGRLRGCFGLRFGGGRSFGDRGFGFGGLTGGTRGLRHGAQETPVGGQDVGYRGHRGHLKVADVEGRRLRLSMLRLAGLLFAGLLLGLLLFGAAVVAAVHLGVVHGRLGEELRLEVLTACPRGFATLGLLLVGGRG